MKSSEDNYEVRVCRIIDARHVEDTGTNDEPSYNQHVQLLLQDADTGATFVAPLSDKDLQDLFGGLCMLLKMTTKTKSQKKIRKRKTRQKSKKIARDKVGLQKVKKSRIC